MRVQITEYLEIDLETERWMCNRCGQDLGSARQSYKRGCLVAQRMPEEVWRPQLPGPISLSPHPDYARLVEFYCPGCGTMVENELLPPGFPITHDIEIDLDALKKHHEQPLT